MNVKSLSIVLVVLLAIVLITQINSKKGDRTFKKQLFDIDTTKITSLSLFPKINNFSEIQFVRKANSWVIIKENKEYNVNIFSIENMIRQINNLVPLRLAGNSKDKWVNFELSDSLATRIVINSEKKSLGELYVGKFGYNPQTQQGSSYVRINKDKEVYAVSGFLQSLFDQDVNNFRFNKLITSNKSDWTKLQFFYPADSSFTLSRENNKWALDGSLLDSVKTETYLNGLIMLNSRNFMDDEDNISGSGQYKLIIEGSNFRPIEINAYPADEENGFYITSSINPGARFSGIKGGLYEKLFKGRSNFEILPE